MNKSVMVFVICLLTGGIADGKNPNVLFIAVDDLRTNLGCYGDPLAATPNIDKLAARSLRFTRAYCQFASCNASRTSVLTGQRPDSISVWKLNTNFRDTAPNAVTLPQHFKRNGYHTEAIGKVLHNYNKNMRDNDLSWSVPARLDKLNHFRDYGLPANTPPTTGKLEKTIVAESADVDDDAYVDGKIVDDAVKTLRKLASSDQPFFLAVGFMKPHSPYNAPKKYWDLYDRSAMKAMGPETRPDKQSDLNWWDSSEIRGFADVPNQGPIPIDVAQRMRHGYYAATSYADANIGKILNALEGSGAADNTIIMFWSDHGYHLGENGHWAKVTVRELDAHVPLLVATPSGLRGKTEAIVEYIDLYPTLSDLCGLPTPTNLDGKSFLSVLENPNSEFREAALTQVCRPWSPKAPIEQMGYSIRTDRYRYTQWLNFKTKETVAEEFYELTMDPYQRDNRIHDVSLTEVLEEHRKLMLKETGR